MCCVGGVVSYERGNAWGIGFESHATQRWEALFFLKLGGPLVPVGVDPGLKDPPLVPDAYSRLGNGADLLLIFFK